MNLPPITSVYQRRRRIRRMGRAIADLSSYVSPRSRRPSRGPPERIGVFLQWGIGDAILALPLLQGLRVAYPDSAVELIGKPWLADLFRDENYVDRTHELVPPWTRYQGKYKIWEDVWRRYLRQLLRLRDVEFDTLISIRRDPRENLQLRLLRSQKIVGFKVGGGRNWITDDIGLSERDYDLWHRSEISVLTLKAMTGIERCNVPRFAIKTSAQMAALRKLVESGYRGGIILAVHSEAGNSLRAWDLSNFNHLLTRLPTAIKYVVIIDDGSDRIKDLVVPGSIPYCRWNSSLSELKNLLSVCDVILCSDSGVMHLAAACGCRVVTIFGPTWKAWFGPSGEGHKVVQFDPMPCRPCFERCVYPMPICMKQVSNDTARQALISVVNSLGPKDWKAHNMMGFVEPTRKSNRETTATYIIDED